MATCTQRPRCANQRPRLGLRRQRRSRGGEGGAAGCRDAPPSACGRAVGRRLRRNPGHRRRRGVRHNGPRGTRAEALRTRGPPAQKRCANGGRCGRSAHAQPLPAVTEGRRAPVAVMARRVVKGLLLLEAAGLLGALLLYRAMDRSQGAGRPGVTPRRGKGMAARAAGYAYAACVGFLRKPAASGSVAWLVLAWVRSSRLLGGSSRTNCYFSFRKPKNWGNCWKAAPDYQKQGSILCIWIVMALAQVGTEKGEAGCSWGRNWSIQFQASGVQPLKRSPGLCLGVFGSAIRHFPGRRQTWLARGSQHHLPDDLALVPLVSQTYDSVPRYHKNKPSTGLVTARFALHSRGLILHSGLCRVQCQFDGKGSQPCYPQSQHQPKGSCCCGWEGASLPASAVVWSYTKFKLNFTYTTLVCICYPRFRCWQAVTLKLSIFAYLLKNI